MEPETTFATDADAELCQFCDRIFTVRELFQCECGSHFACRECVDRLCEEKVELTPPDDR